MDIVARIVDEGAETQANDVGILIDIALLSLTISTAAVGCVTTSFTGLTGVLCASGIVGSVASLKNISDKILKNSEIKEKISSRVETTQSTEEHTDL